MRTERETGSRQARRGLAVVAGAGIAVSALAGVPASADETEGIGIPDTAPPAAFLDEPSLPEAELWPLSENFSHTSGTSRYDAGALLWTDWLYDDTGDGSFTYDAEDAAANGADVFRAGVGAHRNASYWRVDWNTLIDPDLPIAVWGLDTDADPATGTTQWPGAAGVSSPGSDAFLVMSSRGAWLVDGESGAREDLVARGAEVSVDMDARSFVVSIPRSALRVNGEWTVRLVTGIADASGTAFAAPPGDHDARVYNVAFRSAEQENARRDGGQKANGWNNGAQSEALARGDVTAFSLDVDWRRIARGETTPEPALTGFSTKWYVSSVDLGQGIHPDVRQPQGQPPTADPRAYGRVQPYLLYVPESYEEGVAAPLSVLLHGGGGNHNGFRGDNEQMLYGSMCEERGSICITPFGRGDGTWFINEAELDVWEVWNRVAHDYTLDPERAVVGGWSMGGVGATRLAVNYPDVFAAVGIMSGAGYRNAVAGHDSADDVLRVENLSAMRVFLTSGTADFAQQNTRDWEAAFAEAGVPYRAHYYDGAMHGNFGSLGWTEFADRIGDATRAGHPATIAYRWDPREERPDLGIEMDSAYWIAAIEPRDADAPLSRIAARSGALDTVETQPVLTEGSADYDGWETEIRELVLEPIAEEAPRPELELDLTNVASATIDLDSAGLGDEDEITLILESDAEVQLTLHTAAAEIPLTLSAGTHTIPLP